MSRLVLDKFCPPFSLKMNRTVEFRDVIVVKKSSLDREALNEPNGRSNEGPVKKKSWRNEHLADFAKGIKDLVKTISKMKQFLVENRRDYINL